LGSFSKVLAPGLRTAWVVALPALTARIELAKEALDLCSSMLDQAIVSECYRQGLLQTRLPELRTFYRTRCQAMLSALDQHAPKDSHWTKPTGGLFVWLELPITCDSTQLLTRAVEEGVVFVPGAPFFVDNIKQNTMRMAFSKETPERISTAITKLCALI
jgi:2-aminoadipate transaminase